jgi:hypothetical protein
MLPIKNYADRPKTKSAIALMKIILKICTFSIKNHDFTRKKQYIAVKQTKLKTADKSEK